MKKIFIVLSIFSLPFFVSAQIILTEIMYDVEGADDTREWVEVHNEGSEPVDLTDWRFSDGTNHTLVISDEKGGQGSLILAPGIYAILASDAKVFLTAHTGFSGTVIDSVMSLNNSADTLALLDAEKAVRDSVSYMSDLGATGDGKSLQKVGGVWVAGLPSPGAANSSGSNATTSASASQDTSSTTESAASSSSSGAYASSDVTRDTPLQPQMRATIRAEARAIVGADAFFRGELVGTMGNPIAKARFLWNFGDGAVHEGQSVRHIYRHPGNYAVVLEAVSGEFSVPARTTVTAVPAHLTLSAIPAQEQGFIEIRNNGSYDVNLSEWQLSADGTIFVLPYNTVILRGSTVAFPQETTNLVVREEGVVALLYPNGNVAYRPSEKTENASTSPPTLSGLPGQPAALKPPLTVATPAPAPMFPTKGGIPTQGRFLAGSAVSPTPESLRNPESIADMREKQVAQVTTAAKTPRGEGAAGRVWWLAGVLGMVVLASFAVLSFARAGENDESPSITILDD